MRIAVLDDYQKVAMASADWSRLPKGYEVQVFSDHIADRASLVKRLMPFDAVVMMRERTPFTAELIDALPKLRLLLTMGAHNAAIDIEATNRHGIIVCGTAPDLPHHGTAELTWGLLLALARHIVQEDRAVREGFWQTSLGTSLRGSVLGVVGMGGLGTQVAGYGKAFGMETIAWSHNLTAAEASKHGASYVERDDLFKRADFVTLHVRLSARTRGLVGGRELALMKPTAFLVNTSRGPIVDEAALVQALRANRIAGAGLDTFDQEPLPADHPYLELRNVILTPHIGYVLVDQYRSWFSDVIDNICAFADGKPIRVLDKPAGFDPGII